ncbi:MAG: DUF5317 domain-containing protein [Caldilineaceae bacterium]
MLVLLLAVIGGLIAGLLRSAWTHQRFIVPPLYHSELLIIAVLPQLLTVYLPMTHTVFTESMAAIALVSSQTLLLFWGWWNRHHKALVLLTVGLLCNFVVIVSNGGFMPVSPTTLQRLLSPERAATWQIGERIGRTKDRLLLEAETNFAVLSDRFVLPRWFGYAIAYSFGDILIAIGAFWFLWAAGADTHGSPA